MTVPQQISQQQTQHFLLKWNNHRSNMVNVFDSLLNSENLVDCTIAVEGKFLKAHKIVLSACSPYFQTMFINHSPADRYPILLFHDIKYAHLKTLLEFMYRGEISIDEKDLGEVLKVAEALSIRGLSSFESDDEETDNKQESSGTGGNNEEAKTEACNGPSANACDSGSSHQLKNGQKQKGTKKHKMVNSTSSYCQSETSAFGNNGTTRGASEPRDASPTSRTASPALKKDKKGTKAPEPVGQVEVEEIPPPPKKKRGRPKLITTTQAQTASSSVPDTSPVHKSLTVTKPSETKIRPPMPRHGVRRRIPRRYPGLPTRKLKQIVKQERSDTGNDNTTASTSNPYGDIDEALIQQILEGEDCEPLSEMSVRGLDLFKYASVEDNLYRCIECEKLRIPKTFKNKYSFQRHAFLYHEGNMRKVFPCPLCSREFSRPDKMKNHMKSVHEGAGSSSKTDGNNSINNGGTEEEDAPTSLVHENDSSCDS